jgi:site-specific DNA-methyltransferase (adenine-specific)
MNITDKIQITNEDNMLLMARYPDNYFDLAIVDPPYGIGFSDYERVGSGIKTKERHTKNGKKKWDDKIPLNEYFEELKRVSKNQIVWGGNYFPELWLNGCKGFIFWYKHQPVDNFAKGELAYTSFSKPAQCFDFMYYGNINRDLVQLHPTQKPVALYKWLLDKYAKDGDKILDTHLGSGSIAIACHEYGFELTACELDTEYFDKAVERIKNHVSQQKLF